MNLFGFNKKEPAPADTTPDVAAPEPADAATTEEAAAPSPDAAPAQPEVTAFDAEIVPEATSEAAPLDVASPAEAPAAEPPLESTPEPPRALAAGTYLNGEYEIKEVVSRGFINYYLANAGDYGADDWKLVAERLAPANRVETEVEVPFFPPATRFVQEEREYAVWDWQPLKSLDDWNAHPNDETYLSVVGEVARGLQALENAGLQPDLARDSLYFDASGQLKAFGFFDAPGSQAAPMSAVQQLSALSSRFAKTNLAGGATLRLDDEFAALPFSVEVKSFARRLSEGEFASAGEVVVALAGFAPVHKTHVALLSDVGMERELNEDCGLIWKSSRAGHARNYELELLAVADGMGGHEGGEVASDLTLTSLEAAISRRQGLDWNDNAAVLAALGEILVEVNDAVVRLTENPPYASMRAKPGSTLVCALRVGSRAFLGNIGDSRAYRWNAANGLERLTRDHSYVQDLLDSGAITEEQAWGHPDGSVITSHVGMMRGLKRDVFLRLLAPGDKLVLVSDGVVDTLRDPEIEAIIAAPAEVSQLCVSLVNAANDAGGYDNITVAALLCE